MTIVPPATRWYARRPVLRTETLALIASAWFTLACNGSLWQALLDGRTQATIPAWLFLGGTILFVIALQWVLLLLVVSRWTAKPVLTLLIITAAATVYFMDTYHVYMDAPMVRNVL